MSDGSRHDAQRRGHDDWFRIIGDFELEAGQPARVVFLEQRGDGGRGALLDPHQREPAGVRAQSLGQADRRRVRPMRGIERLQGGEVARIECGQPGRQHAPGRGCWQHRLGRRETHAHEDDGDNADRHATFDTRRSEMFPATSLTSQSRHSLRLSGSPPHGKPLIPLGRHPGASANGAERAAKCERSEVSLSERPEGTRRAAPGRERQKRSDTKVSSIPSSDRSEVARLVSCAREGGQHDTSHCYRTTHRADD